MKTTKKDYITIVVFILLFIFICSIGAYLKTHVDNIQMVKTYNCKGE